MSICRSKVPSTVTEGNAILSLELAQQRSAMITEAAYYKALERGFAGGAEAAVEDWLQAEAEIDAQLATAGAPAPRSGTAVPDAEPS